MSKSVTLPISKACQLLRSRRSFHLDGKTPSKREVTDKIKSLSKGNQQKVQLIITMIHEPKLIILDEPFSGLDPVNTEVLKQVIFEEKDAWCDRIFSDHVMTNVEELCDELVMIRDGSVILSGPVQEVRQ